MTGISNELPKTDAQLVTFARTGNRSARDELARRWAARVLAVCRARIRDAAMAEDLAQEALFRSLSRLEQLEDPSKYGAWLRGIAIRVCVDWMRRSSRSDVSFSAMGQCEDPAVTSCGGGVERVEQAEQFAQLQTEIDALPENLREVILLFYYDEVTYQEIADLLDVSRATVNKRLAQARQELGRRLAHLTR